MRRHDFTSNELAMVADELEGSVAERGALHVSHFRDDLTITGDRDGFVQLAAAALRAATKQPDHPDHPFVSQLEGVVPPSHVSAIRLLRRENIREWAPKPASALGEFLGVIFVMLVLLLAASSVVFFLLWLGAW